MAARDDPRRRAVLERERGLAVAAGAGSGKTRLLVDRYVSLVADDGADPRRILAITFTEKAAAEMRRRVLAELGRRGAPGARRLAASAPISTIHGFAASLIRENFHLLGTDPDFRVPGAVESDEFLDAAFDEWFRSGDPEFYRLAARYGERFLRTAVFALVEQEQSLGREAGRLAALAGDLAPERAARRELFELARSEACARAHGALARLAAERPGGKSGQKLARAVELIPRLERGELDSEVLDALKENTSRLAVKKLSETGRAGLAALKDAREELEELSEEAWEAELAAEPFRAALYRVAARTLEEFTAYKRRRGYLDYEDMLGSARDLLRDHPGAAEAARRRYRHVLIDEFQDTNRLQKEIIDLLADGEPGKLFVVGDHRQSIYRFRHAEVEVFNRHVDEMKSGGGLVVPLAENFRGRPELVGFTSSFFTELAPQAFRSMKAAAGYRSRLPGPPVELLLVDQGARPIARARWEEFERLAARIAALIESGVEVWDRDEGRHRPIEFRDVAILTRTRAPFGDLERELERRGVPALAPGGREFYDRAEITDLVSLLAWLADPGDDAAAAAVLRSPFFDLSDDGLFLLARADGGLARCAASGELPADLAERDRARIERARALLAEARSLAGRRSASEVIELCAALTGYFEKILARRRGLAEHANLQRFLSEAARFGPGAGALAAAARYFRRARALAAVETESAAEMGTLEAVSILTVHGAKGLEFPAVAVCDLGREPRGGFGAPTCDPDLGLALEFRDELAVRRETAGARLVRGAERAAERAEAERILYVAVTRAREKLILSGVARLEKPAGRDSGRPVDWVRSVLGLGGAPEGALKFAGIEVGAVPPAPRGAGRRLVSLAGKLGEGFEATKKLSPPKKLAPTKKDLACADRILERVSAGPLSPGPALEARVTELAEMDACPRRGALGLLARLEAARPGYEEPAGDRAPAGSPGGRELGLEAHRILEFLDFVRPGGLPGEAGKLVKRFLASDLARDLAAAQREGRLLREAELRVRLGESMVSGQVDVLVLEGPVEAPAAVRVLDYKTDRDAVGDVEKAARRHELQLRLYAMAAGRAWPGARVTAEIAFLSAGKVVSVDVSEEALRAAEARARGLLAMLGSGEMLPAEGEGCADCPGPVRAICGK